MQYIVAAFNHVYLLFEQVYIMLAKHSSQKMRNGREFLKDSILTQVFFLGFVIYFLYQESIVDPTAHPYALTILPPLSSQSPWGIFGQSSNGNTDDTVISKRLYYSPNDNQGVQDLILALVAKYPDIDAVGAADGDEVNDLYGENIFNTWASIQFALNSQQISASQLVTSQTNPTTVSYTILTNPSLNSVSLSIDNTTDTVYNDQQATADLFWSTGYMTLQNFVATYLAQQYDTIVPTNYSVSNSSDSNLVLS
jgi:hypothetical protein